MPCPAGRSLFPSQTLARSWLLTFPASHPRQTFLFFLFLFFAKELVYRQTRLPCFPAGAYLLQITRVSACPRATSQALTTDTSPRLVAASRGQTLALLGEEWLGTAMFHPGARECSVLAGWRGTRLGSPSLWKERTPRGCSGHCGNGLSEGLVLSCDSSSAPPRPPRASSEELMKSAGCGQPCCSAGMFWSRLLTLCFAYCVSNTACFYTLHVNKGKGLSAPDEVLIGAVSDPAAPRCAARTLQGYSCTIPALLLHYSCIQLSSSLLRTIPAPSLLVFSRLCSSALPSVASTGPTAGRGSLGCSSMSWA